jgi:acyl-CoA synthetase (AMP-forming)/AMP-acid ligase II
MHPELLNPKDTSVLLGSHPFFHAPAFTLLPFLYAGSKVVTLPSFQPKCFLHTIEKYRISNLIIPPPVLLFLAKDQKYDISCIDDILTGAAPVGGDIMKAASHCTGCRLIRKAYGLTETSPITHMMSKSLGLQEPESIGHCIRSMEAKVVDLKSEEALPPHKTGEVWLRGPNVMKGYLNNPEATGKCLTHDGWFKTGDIGRLHT